MTFEFVIETPKHRGINRNNHKIIQKRATQAGARTRLGNRANPKSPDDEHPRKLSIPPTSQRDGSRSPKSSSSGRSLLANASISAKHNSPFLARFGSYGQLLYTRDSGSPRNTTCFRLQNATLSFLQRTLLQQISRYPIARDADRLYKVMQLTQKQFLSHLPSHYGQLQFLDEAVECLIARLHDTIPLIRLNSTDPPVSSTTSPTVSYSRALQSLRTAIDSDSRQHLSYIWFAIMLLTLFELLSMGDEPGWIWHAAGAARMLNKVGPENIKTEFLMSLLSSQCKIMVMESLFSSQTCYLGEPRWQEAIRRTVLDCEDFADRSAVSTELWTLAARLPNVFDAVRRHVHDDDNDYVEDSDGVSPKRIAQDMLDDFLQWQNKWRDVLENTCRNVLRDHTIRHQSLMILLASYMQLAICCRLRIAADPSGCSDLEEDAMDNCLGIYHLREGLMTCQSVLGQSNGSIYCRVTTGVVETSRTWIREIETAHPDVPVDAQVFDSWCEAIGRIPLQVQYG